MTAPLRAWWSQPDQFDWITSFLLQRGMLRPARMIMSVVAGSSALVPLTVLPSQSHPTAVQVVTAVFGAAVTVGMTAMWLTRWPTRRQSQAGAVIGALCIGGWSLIQPTAALAALACTAMAVTGGYMAFFHSLRLLLVNALVATVLAATVVLRLAIEVNVATAVSALWVINFVNLSIPWRFGAFRRRWACTHSAPRRTLSRACSTAGPSRRRSPFGWRIHPRRTRTWRW